MGSGGIVCGTATFINIREINEELLRYKRSSGSRCHNCDSRGSPTHWKVVPDVTVIKLRQHAEVRVSYRYDFRTAGKADKDIPGVERVLSVE